MVLSSLPIEKQGEERFTVKNVNFSFLSFR